MKILVVDDSKAMRRIVQRTVSQTSVGKDATLLEATNGREALDVIGTEQPDLVLSDWNMPEMNGLELLESLRSSEMPVRFGFITSESTPAMYEKAMAGGASFLVTKPFTAEMLDAALSGAGDA